MISTKQIRLLLDDRFITHAAEVYRLALETQHRRDRGNEDNEEEALTITDYQSCYKTAVALVKNHFKEHFTGGGIIDIQEADLIRSYRIMHRLPPLDPLGLVHEWFVTNIAFYIPNKAGIPLRSLPKDATREEVSLHLFREFMAWIVNKSLERSMSLHPHKPAYIDELEAIFHASLVILTETNSYPQQIFHRRSDVLSTEKEKPSVDTEDKKKSGNA